MDNIYRIFNVLPQFPFPTSESQPEYYHQKVNVRVPSLVGERLKI